MIYITSWSDLYPVAERVGASHVISLLGVEGTAARPDGVLPENHLSLAVDDIAMDIAGYAAPGRRHVEELIAFARDWQRQGPIICHCYAGISRSSAAAMILLALYNPGREREAAVRLRAAGEHIQPNRLIIRHADDLLGLDGALIDAVQAIGPGDFSNGARPVYVSIEL